MSESQQASSTPLDHLLQIPARATLMQDLGSHASASNSDQPLSLLWIDLDKFKQVNDLHGHEAGDEVLQGVASALHALHPFLANGIVGMYPFSISSLLPE